VKTALLALLLTFICVGPVILAVLMLLRGIVLLSGSENALDGIIASAVIALILAGAFYIIDAELNS
jgi:hypothetical protein